MPYKNSGSIRIKKISFVHPNEHGQDQRHRLYKLKTLGMIWTSWWNNKVCDFDLAHVFGEFA